MRAGPLHRRFSAPNGRCHLIDGAEILIAMFSVQPVKTSVTVKVRMNSPTSVGPQWASTLCESRQFLDTAQKVN